METLRGTPIFYGHRAWGSLLKYILILFALIAIDLYLRFRYPSILHYVLFTFHIAVTVEYILWLLILIVFVYLMYKHYRWTYLISTKEIVVRRGIIASDIKSYLYDQIQEISTYQTAGQRFLMYGQMNVTMLISLTGQSKVEEAHLPYLHRPKYLSALMMSYVRVGK